ncbi:MAG: hypothetical protein ABIH52_04335 [Candidatus Aenigmatarchaeota archaeon]|nr:hypothetical protein [Nanoarchaeota archaeon]
MNAFSEHLASELKITFSKEAQEKMNSSGIQVGDATLVEIGRVVTLDDDIRKRRNTLILTAGPAFVVAVRKREVKTIYTLEDMKKGIMLFFDSISINLSVGGPEDGKDE